ncbi:hypothetical protein BH11PLA2_BH11PLA2_18390 [soil metagenome]
MNSIIVASPGFRLPDVPSASQQSIETADLLRQMLDVQREQLAHARQATANADALGRWRRFLDRWKDEFPDIAVTCKQVLPAMERVYLKMIGELADRLNSDEVDDFDSEFVLGEFLDKYGQRLNQLGTIIGQLSPIADTVPVPPVEAPAPPDAS